MGEIVSRDDLDRLSNPVELRRFQQAAEVMRLIVQEHKTTEEACKAVGISRATYARWVKDGVFAPLVEAAVGTVIQDFQMQALDAMTDGIQWMKDVVSGQVKDATNFDRMAAIRFLWNEMVRPLMETVPKPEVHEEEEEEEDPARSYLEEAPSWAKKLAPGEVIKRTEIVERQSPAVVDGQAQDPAPEEDQADPEN